MRPALFYLLHPNMGDEADIVAHTLHRSNSCEDSGQILLIESMEGFALGSVKQDLSWHKSVHT